MGVRTLIRFALDWDNDTKSLGPYWHEKAKEYLAEPKLYDLEIVQKALEKSELVMSVDKEGIYLHTDCFNSCEYHFENSKSLLTWAKQTIGESPAPEGE